MAYRVRMFGRARLTAAALVAAAVVGGAAAAAEKVPPEAPGGETAPGGATTTMQPRDRGPNGEAAAHNATTADRQDELPITIELGEVSRGTAFDCRIPVTVRFGDPVGVTAMNVIAKAYQNGLARASTGFQTGDPPLVREPRDRGADYVPASQQFELTEKACADADTLAILLARCTLPDGSTIDCLRFLKVEPKQRDGIRFVVGDPAAAQKGN